MSAASTVKSSIRSAALRSSTRIPCGFRCFESGAGFSASRALRENSRVACHERPPEARQRVPEIAGQCHHLAHHVGLQPRQSHGIRHGRRFTPRARRGRGRVLRRSVAAPLRSRPVMLTEIPPEERAPILKAWCQVATSGRHHLPVPHNAPVSAFEAIAPDYPVFRIGPRSGSV